MTTEVETDQASNEESVESRIANKFGFPGQQAASDESEQTDAQQVPEFAEVEFGGKKFQIPPELKEAFIQNADYTQKTQALAENRKALDHVREVNEQSNAERAFVASVANEQNELAVIDAYLAQSSKQDWSQMSMEQMFRVKQEIDTVKERRQALQSSIEGKRTQFKQNLQTKIIELRKNAREMAAKAISGFSDDTEKAVRAHAASEGLSEGEVDNVLLDPRSFKILYKAMKYDEVQKNVGKAQTATGKALKPGVASERMPQKTVEKLNFNKAMNAARSSGDKARVIEGRLAGMFGRK